MGSGASFSESSGEVLGSQGMVEVWPVAVADDERRVGTFSAKLQINGLKTLGRDTFASFRLPAGKNAP